MSELRRPERRAGRSESVVPAKSAVSGASVAPRATVAPAPWVVPATTINTALFDWSATQGRHLPLRDVTDPWRVLVAEVMSQQTQFARALSRAESFCAIFPTPAALAAAAPADAIRAWAGLGYNRRAVALHRAAVRIVRLHGGSVPDAVDALDALPGVGPYTARAVAAQAFGLAVGPVDVNIARVLVRLSGGRPQARELQGQADRLVDPGHPGQWVHAMMDLAGLVCLPRVAPHCAECPLRRWCRSADLMRDVTAVAGLTASRRAGVDSQGRAVRSCRPRSAGPPPLRASPAPFVATRRWLRGALVQELRGAPADRWVVIAGGRGLHDPTAVQAALLDLCRDGLLDRDDVGAVRLARSEAT